MKIISSVLAASLLCCIGCYNNRTVTKEELKAKVEPVDIAVYTKGFTEYKFSRENYRIQGDSLTGFGVQVGKERMKISAYSEQLNDRSAAETLSENTSLHDSVVVSIAFADISRLVANEYNLSNTIVAIVLTVGISLGAIALLFPVHTM